MLNDLMYYIIKTVEDNNNLAWNLILVVLEKTVLVK